MQSASDSPDASAILPFVRRLERHANIGVEARRKVLALPHSLRQLKAGRTLVREGERPDESRLVVSGFVFRHKLTGDGARQIVSVHIPGEIVDLHNSFLDVADHTVQALTDVEVALIPRASLRSLDASHPELARAMLTEALIDASILMEWLLSVGRRDAVKRIGHLLCELALRLDAAGLAENGRYEVPFTQEQIADAVGLTQVHVNRMLKRLEADGLIGREKRSIEIRDWAALAERSDFDPRYLHLRDAEGGEARPWNGRGDRST